MGPDRVPDPQRPVRPEIMTDAQKFFRVAVESTGHVRRARFDRLASSSYDHRYERPRRLRAHETTRSSP